MGIEIEAKIRVDDLRLVEEKLRALDGQLRETVREEDVYFDSAGGELAAGGCGLRLRRRTNRESEKSNIKDKKYISKIKNKESATQNDVRVYLTYKGPKGKSIYKSRQEAEVEVSDFECALRILEGLGYKRRIAFEKRRRVFDFKGCIVCLDELPVLGRFVEVEGPDEEAIGRVLKDIGLDGAGHIPEGYAKMMSRAVWDDGVREVYFEKRQ